MDILHLVDRLEELFNQSRSIPFTHSVVVDEDRMLDIIDQMKASIPEEIKKAQQLMAQRDRLLAQAVAGFRPDWVVLAGWMRLLTSAFLDMFPSRVINLHPALPGTFPRSCIPIFKNCGSTTSLEGLRRLP